MKIHMRFAGLQWSVISTGTKQIKKMAKDIPFFQYLQLIFLLNDLAIVMHVLHVNTYTTSDPEYTVFCEYPP
jgi:hypothetical protein